MNPFAQFSFGSSLTPTPESGNVDALLPTSRKRDERPETTNPQKLTKKSKTSLCIKSKPEVMSSFWVELSSLTTNYPFAVLLTGVLGAQTRDVVTVGVIRQLAELLQGNICPAGICQFSFEELEKCIKRLNYCHKKTRSMMDLATIFQSERVPSTMHGLKTIPGVGPVISEIVLRVAFGSKFGMTNGSSEDVVSSDNISEQVNLNESNENMDDKSESVSDVETTGEDQEELVESKPCPAIAVIDLSLDD